MRKRSTFLPLAQGVMRANVTYYEVRRPVLIAFAALLAASVGHASDAWAQQPLETETATLSEPRI